MAPDKIDIETFLEGIKDVRKQIDDLAKAIDGRFERMKKVIIDYLTLGNQMAQGSLITALKQV